MCYEYFASHHLHHRESHRLAGCKRYYQVVDVAMVNKRYVTKVIIVIVCQWEIS